MVEKVDEKWYQTKNLYFKDQGPIAPGRVTRLFNVSSKHDSSFLGVVRWLAQWRQYTFSACNCILNKDCLREIADFVEERTNERREESRKV